MTWCITASNEDVDVDVLFEENANIGQKIALTEKIVAVLPRLKCPLRLEPHQIQGIIFCVCIFETIYVCWAVNFALDPQNIHHCHYLLLNAGLDCISIYPVVQWLVKKVNVAENSHRVFNKTTHRSLVSYWHNQTWVILACISVTYFGKNLIDYPILCLSR